MQEIMTAARPLFLTCSIVAVVVLLAMMVDLAAGLYKAGLRGDLKTSEALKRTGLKFILYEGCVLLASFIDLLIHLGKLFLIIGWDMACGVPFVTLAVGIFWCVVEGMSVREKADEKIHSNISKAEHIAALVLKIAEAVRKGKDVDLTDEDIKNITKELDPVDNNVL